MIDQPRVIAGTYADVRFDKFRNVVQMVVEVPGERADELSRVFGWPKPGSELWVAIAPLSFDPYSQRGRALPAPPEDERQRAVTACAIRCTEPQFQQFLLGRPKGRPWTEDEAAAEVRRRLNIGSRREIATNLAAFRAWKALLAQFMEEYRAPPPR